MCVKPGDYGLSSVEPVSSQSDKCFRTNSGLVRVTPLSLTPLTPPRIRPQVARTKCAPNAHQTPTFAHPLAYVRMGLHQYAPGCIRLHYLVDKYYCAKYITYATHDFYKSFRGEPAAFVLQGLGCWFSFFALPLHTPCCVHLGYETSIHQARHP